MKEAALFLVTVLFFLMTFACDAKVFRARDFGAHADDGSDDTRALASLFAKASEFPDSTILLDPGTYQVSARQGPAVFLLRHVAGMDIHGNRSTISVSGLATLFKFEDSEDLHISGLIVRWSPSPTMSVTVVSVDGATAVLESLSPQQAMIERPLLGWLPWDQQKGRPAANTFERYWKSGEGPRLTALGGNRFSVSLAGYPQPLSRGPLKAGDTAALRFQIYGCNAFSFLRCRDVHMKTIEILSAPGTGIAADDSKNISLDAISIHPTTTKDFLSTAADATHFNGCRGHLSIKNSRFEAMGDDGVNVRNPLWRVMEIGFGNTIRLRSGKNPPEAISLPRVNDTLLFAPEKRPLDFHSGGKVVSAKSVDRSLDVIVTLDSSLPVWAAAGSTCANVSATCSVAIDHLEVLRNRARGILLQTPRKVVVRFCKFIGNSGPAIKVTCDTRRWWEGLPARDVTIENCVIAPANDGPGKFKAPLSIHADEASREAPYGVFRGISIKNNQFSASKKKAVYFNSCVTIPEASGNIYLSGNPR